VLGDGAHDVAEHRQVGADDQASLGVEQSRIEVFLLANERRHGRALDHGLHLALDGPERAAHDLQRDGIDGGRAVFGPVLCALHLLIAPALLPAPVTGPGLCRKILRAYLSANVA
jgi:hypothetical protein